MDNGPRVKRDNMYYKWCAMNISENLSTDNMFKMNKICRTRKWMRKKWDKEITAKRTKKQKGFIRSSARFGSQFICLLFLLHSIALYSVPYVWFCVWVCCWFDKQWDEICNVKWRFLAFFLRNKKNQKNSHQTCRSNARRQSFRCSGIILSSNPVYLSSRLKIDFHIESIFLISLVFFASCTGYATVTLFCASLNNSWQPTATKGKSIKLDAHFNNMVCTSMRERRCKAFLTYIVCRRGRC